jgi:hypothetical protein
MAYYIDSRDCDECLTPYWDEFDSVLCADCLDKS